MAREISPVCDLIFGLIRTCLLTDTVDVDLTVRTVKVYTHTERITLWSLLFLLHGVRK